MCSDVIWSQTKRKKMVFIFFNFIALPGFLYLKFYILYLYDASWPGSKLNFLPSNRCVLDIGVQFRQQPAWLEGTHRRRIKTEEKAKVAAAAWGTELIKFFAALAILHQDDLMNRMNSTRTMFGGQHWFNSLLL